MSANAGTDRRPHGSLSRDEILDAAHDLVAERGLRGLTMPALARRLGSGTTTIYWYFRNKDELVAAVTDRVSREMYRELPPIGDGAWHDEIFEYFVSFQERVRSNPIFLEVFTYRVRFLFLHSSIAPYMLRRLEAGLAVFEQAGFSPEEAIAAMNTCANYTRGYFVLEHDMGTDRSMGPASATLDERRHPVLGPLGGFDDRLWLDDDEFRLGLRILIDGIRAQFEGEAP